MDSNNKILVAIDLGADTESILAYALWFAEIPNRNANEITLLHVMDYALTPPSYLLPYMEKEKSASEGTLNLWKQKLQKLGVNAKCKIAAGRLVETFNNAIKEDNFQMLALGYKSHIIRPSSSERLIKSLNIPMLAVRGEKSVGKTLGSVSIKTILCAVDFSENSKKALEFAKNLSSATSSSLIIVNIVSSLEIDDTFRKLKEMNEPERENYREHLAHEAEEKICSFLRSCGGAENIVRIGVPYKAIIETAMEKDSDLIVMGARGLSYTKGIILGSVSESVLKSSPCPVMIVH